MEEKQIIEVDYNKDLVEEYKNNYIMEDEGIGAEPDVEPYGTQDTINETPINELFDPEDSSVEAVEKESE